jgi:acetyltransferase-like isoleucine patch superfamily enzyme
MNRITLFFILTIIPVWKSFLSRLLYSGKNVVIGKNFRADSIPRLVIEKDAKLIIGDNVQFRSGIEIRAHKNSVIRIGDNVRLDRGIRLLSTNNSLLQIGKGSRIGLNTIFNGGDSIDVGADCLISGFCYLQTSMHKFDQPDIPIQQQGYKHLPIILHDNVWLGTHVVLLPGTTLGRGTVVGSNAVVTKSFGDNKVLAGVPAKEISNRNDI